VVVLETATEVPNQSPGTVPEPASSASCLPAGGAARWPATAPAGPAFVAPANPVIVPAATTTALTRLFSLTVSFCATCSQGRNVIVLGGNRSRPFRHPVTRARARPRHATYGVERGSPGDERRATGGRSVRHRGCRSPHCCARREAVAGRPGPSPTVAGRCKATDAEDRR
jgi:hypothetical protein